MPLNDIRNGIKTLIGMGTSVTSDIKELGMFWGRTGSFLLINYIHHIVPTGF